MNNDDDNVVVDDNSYNRHCYYDKILLSNNISNECYDSCMLVMTIHCITVGSGRME